MTIPLSDEVVVHRLLGSQIANLRLSRLDLTSSPPGLSIMAGGSPADAVRDMRTAFAVAKKWKPPIAVGSATVSAIREAGFEVVADPTARFANHGLIVHPLGEAGFTDENLAKLSAAFTESTGY